MIEMTQAMQRIHEILVGQSWFTIAVLLYGTYLIHRLAQKHGVGFDFHIWKVNGKDKKD